MVLYRSHAATAPVKTSTQGRAADKATVWKCKVAVVTPYVTPQYGWLQDLELAKFLLHTLTGWENYGILAMCGAVLFFWVTSSLYTGHIHCNYDVCAFSLAAAVQPLFDRWSINVWTKGKTFIAVQFWFLQCSKWLNGISLLRCSILRGDNSNFFSSFNDELRWERESEGGNKGMRSQIGKSCEPNVTHVYTQTSLMV